MSYIYCCRRLKKLIVNWTGRLIRKSGRVLFFAILLCYRTWPFNISSKPCLSFFHFFLLSSLGGTNKFFVFVQRHNEDVSEFCVSHYSARQPIWMMRNVTLDFDWCKLTFSFTWQMGGLWYTFIFMFKIDSFCTFTSILITASENLS